MDLPIKIIEKSGGIYKKGVLEAAQNKALRCQEFLNAEKEDFANNFRNLQVEIAV